MLVLTKPRGERKTEMGSEGDQERSKPSNLSLLLSKPEAYPSPERPNVFNSPLHTLATVPFCWEEEPGKPKCSAAHLNTHSYSKCLELELPPRLMFATEITKLSSPTSRRFEASPFKMMTLGSGCYGSFRSNYSPAHGETEEQQPGALVLAGRRGGYSGKSGFLGVWKKKRALKGKREVGGGSYVFPSYMNRKCQYSTEGKDTSNTKITEINRAGSIHSLSASKSHFWATMYEGLKQAVPWKNKKSRREGF